MNRNKKIVLIISLVLLSIIGVVIYLLYGDVLTQKLYEWRAKPVDQNSSNSEFTALPLELDATFDPSETSGKFRVHEVDLENNNVVLIYVWPNIKQNLLIRPKIACNPWDIKVFDPGSEVPKRVLIGQLMKIMRDTPKDRMLFSGICNNSTCSEIAKDCQLHLSLGTRNESQ